MAKAILKLALSLWIGGIGIFTFVLTPTLFRSLDRDDAGRIVGLLFPGYFRWGLACGVVALIAVLFVRGRFFVPSVAVLIFMLVLTGIDAFWIEPRVAALKKEIPSFVTTPKDDPRRKEFSRLHGLSAASNLLVFGGGVALIVLP